MVARLMKNKYRKKNGSVPSNHAADTEQSRQFFTSTL
jgi:hypothetical protein